MSQQGLRQASAFTAGGSTQTNYNGAWLALFDAEAVPAGDYNGRLLAYINQQLGTAYTEINGAMYAFSQARGATSPVSWGSMGTFTNTLLREELTPAQKALLVAKAISPDLPEPPARSAEPDVPPEVKNVLLKDFLRKAGFR